MYSYVPKAVKKTLFFWCYKSCGTPYICCRITFARIVWLFLCFLALQCFEVHLNLFDVDLSQGVSIGSVWIGHAASGHRNWYRRAPAASPAKVNLDARMPFSAILCSTICTIQSETSTCMRVLKQQYSVTATMQYTSGYEQISVGSGEALSTKHSHLITLRVSLKPVLSFRIPVVLPLALKLLYSLPGRLCGNIW